MRRLLLILLIFGLVCMITGPPLANAATEQEKRHAIDAGLAYLASTQLANGSWSYGGGDNDTAATAAALLAFSEDTNGSTYVNTHNGGDNVVQKATQYLLSKAQTYNITNQPAGDPDSNGDGLGVHFVAGTTNSRDTYVSGLVVPALVSVYKDSPSSQVTSGPLTGWTAQKVVQNAVDYFAYGQCDSGSGRGGWRYYANSGIADNSTSQWPIVSLLYAGQMSGVTIPSFVKSELETWVNYIQNPDGGSNYAYYNDPNWGSNMSRTGGLLAEMALLGYKGGTAAEQQRYASALGYINANWNTNILSTWNGNFGHPYAMWGVYKGLQSNIGLTGTEITPRAQAGAMIDPGDTWNWHEDYCESLVRTQTLTGMWSGYSYWTGVLATAWNINILRGDVVVPPDDVPEPTTLAIWSLLGASGLALARVRRRRKT